MTSPSRPIAVAITGGIGAGKTEALQAFARHGAATISSDEIVHRLLAEDGAVREAVVGRFGDRVAGPEGRLDRAAIAEIVFADRGELDWLEQLLHPRVVWEYERWREGLERMADPPRVSVAEIPLLYETGGEGRFDAVVVITAPEDVRARRARVPLAGRNERLLPEVEKVERANYVYVNDGSLEELERFVTGVLDELVPMR